MRECCSFPAESRSSSFAHVLISSEARAAEAGRSIRQRAERQPVQERLRMAAAKARLAHHVSHADDSAMVRVRSRP